ncbi:MAG: hypothetical protein BRD49_04075, partial [Bacteroidetes bacterium SW_10_40_5]
VKFMTVAEQDVVETHQVPTEGSQAIKLANSKKGVYLVPMSKLSWKRCWCTNKLRFLGAKY